MKALADILPAFAVLCLLVAICLVADIAVHDRATDDRVPVASFKPVADTDPPKHPKVPAETTYEKEPLSYAVMFALQAKLDDSLDAFEAKDHDKASILKRVAGQRQKIDCIRAWALKLPNRQAAEEYGNWLDWYSNRADEAEKEANSPKGEDVAKVTEEEQRKRDLEAGRRLVIPKPIDCEVADKQYGPAFKPQMDSSMGKP